MGPFPRIARLPNGVVPRHAFAKGAAADDDDYVPGSCCLANLRGPFQLARVVRLFSLDQRESVMRSRLPHPNLSVRAHRRGNILSLTCVLLPLILGTVAFAVDTS